MGVLDLEAIVRVTGIAHSLATGINEFRWFIFLLFDLESDFSSNP